MEFTDLSGQIITTSLRPKPIDDGECKGNHPQMAELFRLVNYCILPRSIFLMGHWIDESWTVILFWCLIDKVVFSAFNWNGQFPTSMVFSIGNSMKLGHWIDRLSVNVLDR